ncbi:MAG: hypothetical protein CM1200mP38_1440 [Dehalococcoidia bacterium]|nr:MAG: hypothetical protein CM1200mP38_1440 [Dehalococcoidia bacterium]
MGFAPMPMFASYGQLTALMIFFPFFFNFVFPSLINVDNQKKNPNPE